MIKKPPSLSYSPFQPPKWSADQKLEVSAGSPFDIATSAGLSFGHVVSAVIGDDELGDVELRWPASSLGPLAVVLLDRDSVPVDAFVLPQAMVDKSSRDGDDWAYSLTPRRRHHVAVLEEIARLEATPTA